MQSFFIYVLYEKSQLYYLTYRYFSTVCFILIIVSASLPYCLIHSYLISLCTFFCISLNLLTEYPEVFVLSPLILNYFKLPSHSHPQEPSQQKCQLVKRWIFNQPRVYIYIYIFTWKNDTCLISCLFSTWNHTWPDIFCKPTAVHVVCSYTYTHNLDVALSCSAHIFHGNEVTISMHKWLTHLEQSDTFSFFTWNALSFNS